MILHCTSKVLKEAGVGMREASLPTPRPTLDPLEDWYAHMFYRNRKKCLIFTNADSLFSFVVEGVKKSEIQSLRTLFIKEYGRTLFYEEFSAQEINALTALADVFHISKTENRNVVGSMNELVFQYKSQWENPFAPFSNEGVVGRNKDLCRMLMKNSGPSRDYGQPLEEFRKIVEANLPRKKPSE